MTTFAPFVAIWNIHFKIWCMFYQFSLTSTNRTKPDLCTNVPLCGVAWCRHQMETFSALLAICAGNSPGTGEFPAQRPLTRSFGVFFDLRLNKRLSEQCWGWWFETLSRPLWRHRNGQDIIRCLILSLLIAILLETRTFQGVFYCRMHWKMSFITWSR